MHGRDEDKRLKLADAHTKSPFAEPVVLPLEDSIDLHPFHPKDIPSVVEEYLEQCCQAGLKEVRIIHGRGTGVQRNIVRSILQKHPWFFPSRMLPQKLAAGELRSWCCEKRTSFRQKGSSPLALMR